MQGNEHQGLLFDIKILSKETGAEERRGKAHAGAQRNRKEEGIRTHTYLLGRHQGNRSHQHSRSCIADKHRHQRSGEVDACQESCRSHRTQTLYQPQRNQGRSTRLLKRRRHRHHGGNQHDTLPVDGLVSRLHIPETSGKDGQQSGDDDDAHREEAEESKRLITALGQYFIDNQPGR